MLFAAAIVAALGAVVVGGVSFAFSSCVMPALARLPARDVPAACAVWPAGALAAAVGIGRRARLEPGGDATCGGDVVGRRIAEPEAQQPLAIGAAARRHLGRRGIVHEATLRRAPIAASRRTGEAR